MQLLIDIEVGTLSVEELKQLIIQHKPEVRKFQIDIVEFEEDENDLESRVQALESRLKAVEKNISRRVR